MDINSMRYTIENEVERRLRADLEQHKMLRSLKGMFILIAGLAVGYLIAKINW